MPLLKKRAYKFFTCKKKRERELCKQIYFDILCIILRQSIKNNNITCTHKHDKHESNLHNIIKNE